MSTAYDAWVLDHGRAPRNTGPLPDATHTARLDNPFCGDRVTLALRIDGGVVREARFEARACAICTASASLLTTLVPGLGVDAALALAAEARLATDQRGGEPAEAVAPLAVFRRAPTRRRCATLPFEALVEALAGKR
jgi:nitrogen fixation NifU-like protein